MIRAFSLVELSIVLVILGLLTGGVLTGQSLIRAAELRAVVSEYERYITASRAFRNRYMAMPGDFREATRFWNQQANQSWCAAHSGASVVATGTCNGNGDGNLNVPANANEGGEIFQFWRQLALAGLIEGNYDGVAGSGGYGHGRIGITVPASKLSSAGWGIYKGINEQVDGGVGNNLYAGNYINTLTFGTGGTTVYPYLAALKPEEAWNIDTKLDDGRPAYGAVRSWRGSGTYTPNCADNASGSAARYNVQHPNVACALLFIGVL